MAEKKKTMSKTSPSKKSVQSKPLKNSVSKKTTTLKTKPTTQTKKSSVIVAKSKTKDTSQTKITVAENLKPLKSDKNLIISAVSFVLSITIMLGIGFGFLASHKSISLPNNPNTEITIPAPERGVYNAAGDLKPKDPYEVVSLGQETIFDQEDIVDFAYDNNFKTTTMVGFSGQQIGTVERNVPEKTRDEGLGVYPKFGYTLSTVIGNGQEQRAARSALIAESNYLCATGTHNNSGNGGSYTWMDKDGYLYKGTVSNPDPALDKYSKHRRLYKHSASAGLYLGDVAEDEPGIIKQVTIRPRGYNSYSVTGVYAPAGEIIKIQISEADMEATGGLTIHIGQALYNGQANNIWLDKGQMQRFPVILNTMVVNKNTATLENGVYTAYVGSFIGGPLYIRNTRATFTATISGGVAYSHFILGYTTKEEFEANAKSSAPYFDLEVWNYGVLHSGPKYYARNFTYEDIYKAAVLWEKVSSVTTTGSSQGVVFLYDPFVAAGAAVAFPGRSSVNCPAGWMSSSLNYNSMVTSGAWGNFHEYHHNFQGYGVGNGGEVTNNGMTLVSYALFTKISAARGISNYGAAGLGGWNSYTSATWALNEVLKIPKGQTPSNGNQGLTLYATLLHNFGADNYIQAKVQQQKQSYGQYYLGYLKAWQDVTHNDMTYFFTDILKGITPELASEWTNPNYSMFVPVSSVYQTGRSYMYDGVKKYFNTMQPYIIPYGETFNIDLSKYNAPNGQYASGSIVIPEGFEYTIKNITTPESGSIERIDDFNFRFTPGQKTRSGKIIVTLGITKNDDAFTVDDVDLVLEFEQSHETNKTILTRTTYTYDAENMYTDAQTAYENNYQGFNTVNESAHRNPTQNCNTDIWLYPNTQENHDKYPNAPDSYFVSDNNIAEVKGKLYFNESGKYRIYLRGRMNCAVYYSIDGGETYQLGATIKDTTVPSDSHLFRPNNENTYFDLDLEEGSWVYFKSVLIIQSSPTVSYIGLGTAKWTEPMFTIVNKYYDAHGNEVSEAEAVRTETHYYDYQGNEVSEAEANNAELIAPSSTAQPNYVNAYRENYEFPSNTGFTSDYMYTRKYSYTYSQQEKFFTPVQTCVSSNYKPWDNTETHSLNNLFDNDDNTFIHSNREAISESNKFSVTVRLDAPVTANRLTFVGSQVNNGRYVTYMPKKYKVWVSNTGGDNEAEWTLVSSHDNAPYSNNYRVVAQFDDYHTFSYYKVEVTATHARNNLGYICLNKIELSSLFTLPNGSQFSMDSNIFSYTGNWNGMQTQSSFGHVYVGKAGSTVSFNFTGKRIAILSSSVFGKNFEVSIDGRKINSIELEEITNSYGASYVSSELTNTTHTVVIKCLSDSNIDSIVTFS